MKQLIVMLATFLASINIAYGYDFKYDDFYCTIISNEDKTVSVSAHSNASMSNSNNTFTELTIPQSVSNNGAIYTVTDIGSFRNSEKLTSVTIPSSVTSIGDDAFSGCTGLTSVSIPSSVTSIGDYAFSGCKGLTSVSIPSSVIFIGNCAFYGCAGLEKVNISDILAWFNISFHGAYANPLECAHHLYLNDEEIKDLVIPEDVAEIKRDAFAGCAGLTEVSIPSSVTCIGSSAFEDCTGLTSVNIPSSVTSIGEGAFAFCSDCA